MKLVSTPASNTVTMTNANQEYTLTIPAGTKRFLFRQRSSSVTIRFAWVTGKVAGSTNPFHTLFGGETYYETDCEWQVDKTLYLASGTAGQVIELLTWQ